MSNNTNNKKLHFTKMHGLSNDFIVLNAISDPIELTPRQIRQLANRHTGIGFDQCLIVEAPKDDSMDFYYRIINAAGNEVGQCGNGARCLAKFIRDNQLSDADSYRVKTKSSRLELKPISDIEIFVEFDEPLFAPQQIPINHQFQADYYPFSIKGETHYLHCASVGNPHGMMVVDNIWQDHFQELGVLLSEHPKFIEGANITFANIIDKQHVKIRVFERGAGETLACGSAALVTAACLRLFHKCAEKITVNLPGGNLEVHWKGLGHNISFIGPAETVFDGTILI